MTATTLFARQVHLLVPTPPHRENHSTDEKKADQNRESRHRVPGLGRAALGAAQRAPRAADSGNKSDGYLLGSYRIATAPEPNSSRLTSFKSTHFDSPANKVGPWPASLGCTTNSYSSINPSSANASGSFTPPTNSPLPDSRFNCCTVFSRSPRTSSAFQSTRSSVLDTTYFFAASIVRAKGSIQSGLAPVRTGGRNAASIIW